MNQCRQGLAGRGLSVEESKSLRVEGSKGLRVGESKSRRDGGFGDREIEELREIISG